MRSWAEQPVQVWWKCALVVAIVMTHVTVIQVRAHLREQDILEHGLPVTARIVELNNRKLGTGSYRPSRETENYVKLEGTLPHGQPFKYEGILPKQDGFAELGGVLPLRVDANDQSRWVEVREQRAFWHELMAVFLLAPVILLMLALAQWRRMAVLKVWKLGKERDGFVVSCKHSAMAPRSRVCRYTVPDPFDRRVFHMLYPIRHGVPREGDMLKLLVLPDQPGHAIVAEFYVRPVVAENAE